MSRFLCRQKWSVLMKTGLLDVTRDQRSLVAGWEASGNVPSSPTDSAGHRRTSGSRKRSTPTRRARRAVTSASHRASSRPRCRNTPDPPAESFVLVCQPIKIKKDLKIQVSAQLKPFFFSQKSRFGTRVSRLRPARVL